MPKLDRCIGYQNMLQITMQCQTSHPCSMAKTIIRCTPITVDCMQILYSECWFYKGMRPVYPIGAKIWVAIWNRVRF